MEPEVLPPASEVLPAETAVEAPIPVLVPNPTHLTRGRRAPSAGCFWEARGCAPDGPR